MAISYTQNWPHEPLIDNRPTADAVIWSLLSFVRLLAGIGGMVWYFGSQSRQGDDEAEVPHHDPLLGYRPTPSQKATLKYFYVAAALLLLQIGLGALTAHYGVEGAGFYGIPLDTILPYAVTRTWHTQLGIFWIATAWLATGLFMAPAVGGHESRGQRFLVNVLFTALVVIVFGSLAGEWLSVQQKLHGDAWFWFGHQGHEYVDLGRRWWVIHLWVEGFFEVFATVVIAFLFSRLQLIRMSTATSASLFSTSVFLAGGIIGTFHHLYFAGTPSVVMALGATFSALEVVPLVLIGFEAWENIRRTPAAPSSCKRP
jgi:nitric oxide reductase large subunit